MIVAHDELNRSFFLFLAAEVFAKQREVVTHLIMQVLGTVEVYDLACHPGAESVRPEFFLQGGVAVPWAIGVVAFEH